MAVRIAQYSGSGSVLYLILVVIAIRCAQATSNLGFTGAISEPKDKNIARVGCTRVY